MFRNRVMQWGNNGCYDVFSCAGVLALGMGSARVEVSEHPR